MEIFIAVLGSSTVAAIITAIVTIIQNRKNNSINHITEERKVWREKIREIAVDIKKSKYRGEGKENIDNNLIQLQIRINTYGILKKSDFKRDGHIWESIERLQSADNEEIFEQEKEILLRYISLMLKEDWEFSKREIKGLYSNLFFIFMYVFLFIVSTIYYFTILKINNIWEYAIFQVLVLLFGVILKFYIHDKIIEIAGNKKLHTLEKIKKTNGKNVRFSVFTVILIVMYLIGTNVFLYFFVLNRIFDNTVYYVQEEKIDIYVNGIDEKYLYSFKKLMEESFDKSINIVNNNEEKEKIYDKNQIGNGEVIDREVYDRTIRAGLSDQMWKPNIILQLLYIVYMMGCMILILDYKKIIKEQEPEKLIMQIQYAKRDLYMKEISELISILSYIIEMEDFAGEKYEELLGLEIKILINLKIGLNSKYDSLNVDVYTLEEYEYMDKIKNAINIVDNSIDALNSVAGRITDLEKRNVFYEIRSNIENLYDMGNLFKK